MEKERNISQLLKSRREDLGYDISNVSEATKIRRQYIDAMEQGMFSSIPAKVYLLAYIRNYAYYLGLNGDSIVKQFQNHNQEVAEEQERSRRWYSGDIKNKPGKILIFTTIIVCLLLYYLLHAYQADYDKIFVGQYPVPANVLKPHSDQQVEKLFYVVDEVNDYHTMFDGPTAMAYINQFQNSDTKIVLLSRGNTLLKIIDNHNRLLAETKLNRGGTYFVPNDSNISILANNPELLDVYIEGSDKDDVVIPHILSDNGKTIYSPIYTMR